MLGLLVCPCWELWLESPFPSVIMVCSKVLAAHQGNHPISYSFLSCCHCAGNTCKLPKQLLGGLEGSRLESSHLLAPSTWLWAHTSVGAARRVGIPHSPGREGGRGSTTHLPPAFPVAPGNHSNTPCYDFSSGGLGCGRSQAFPDSSLCRVLLLLPCLVSSLAVSEPFPSPGWVHVPPLLHRTDHTRKWN